MKYRNIFSTVCLFASLAVATTACDEDIEIGNYDTPDYGSSAGVIYVTDDAGSTYITTADVNGSQDVNLYANVTTALSTDATVSFAYNADALTSYNTANETDYQALPSNLVSFANGGSITLAAGATQSSPMVVTIKTSESLDAAKTYVVPVTITTSGSASVASSSATRLIFVNNLSNLPNCAKTVVDANGNVVDGIKMFSCMEVNDTNPLNNLKYTLKSSGKLLFDALIIFSANINYDATTGRVYVLCNENVQALLSNREKYLKPLQDRGMKVILGLLGNHDCSGVANLSDETARQFAKEVKAICDAYNLDGVFYDDEYSAYETPVPTGFVAPSRAAASRLIYEVWKVQPQRWNIAYVYSRTYGLDTVDGVLPGTYCEYALHDYGGSADLSSYFEGMPKSHMGLYSQEFAQTRIASQSNLQKMRDNGYGAHMIFALDPYRSNNRYQEIGLQRCAQAFYDDELVVDPTSYAKDW